MFQGTCKSLPCCTFLAILSQLLLLPNLSEHQINYQPVAMAGPGLEWPASIMRGLGGPGERGENTRETEYRVTPWSSDPGTESQGTSSHQPSPDSRPAGLADKVSTHRACLKLSARPSQTLILLLPILFSRQSSIHLVLARRLPPAGAWTPQEAIL